MYYLDVADHVTVMAGDMFGLHPLFRDVRLPFYHENEIKPRSSGGRCNFADINFCNTLTCRAIHETFVNNNYMQNITSWNQELLRISALPICIAGMLANEKNKHFVIEIMYYT